MMMIMQDHGYDDDDNDDDEEEDEDEDDDDNDDDCSERGVRSMSRPTLRPQRASSEVHVQSLHQTAVDLVKGLRPVLFEDLSKTGT